MEYWFIFLVVCIITTIILLKPRSERVTKKILGFLCVFLIYFSGFRDGLGEDYKNYILKLTWDFGSDFNWYSEPTFTLFSKIIKYTVFSPVLLFLIFALITITCFFAYYRHQEKENISASLIMFCLIPILYFNTFNLVRQTCACALFFYSLSFINKNAFWKYCIVIALAASIHFSSLILLPLYFVLNRNIRSIWLVLLAIMPSILSPFFGIIVSYLTVFETYTHYLNTDEEMGSSMMIILYNVIGFLCLLFRKHIIKTKWDNISLNILFLLIAFSNLSFNVFYAFRLSVFFMPVFAYIFPLVVSYFVKSKVLTYCISLMLSLTLFGMLVLGNKDNEKIVPDKILPVTALEDQTFSRYYR